MIVVTGAAGFIGSYIVGKLNREGFNDIVLVDKYDDPLKFQNYTTKTYTEIVDRFVSVGFCPLNPPNLGDFEIESLSSKSPRGGDLGGEENWNVVRKTCMYEQKTSSNLRQQHYSPP